MAIQMTRAEYEAKYGQPPAASAAPVKMTRAQYDAKYNAPAATPAPKPSLGQKITKAATAVTKFVGAEGIAEQFGADIARARAPEAEKNLIAYPSMKKVMGSAIQSGANLIPGAGVGAGIARKVATGAATGYAMDVGAKLQNNNTIKDAAKPGLGTAIGAALPVAGKLLGASNMASKTKKLANTLEQQNLRQTPVERQNLAKQGKDVANFLASKKLVGTPDQRLAKVSQMYDDMERNITRVVDGSKVTVPKLALLDELKKIPEKYADNLSEYDSVVAKVERMMETLKKNKGDTLSASSLNAMKRNEWQNAFAKNNTDVINDVSFETAAIMKKILDKSIKGLEPLNKEYGMLIASRKQLMKAASRNQAGIFGRAIGVMAGTSAGAAVGGAPGAAVGAFIGDRAANMTATPVRSTLGAGMQIASEGIKKARVPGNPVQPVRKALLQSFQTAREPKTPTNPETPQSLSQEIPSPNPSIDPGTVNPNGSITLPGPVTGKPITIDPMMGGGTIGKAGAKAAVTAADMMKDGMLSMLRKGAPKVDNFINPKLDDDAVEFVKFLEETPKPTIAQMNKGFEILRRQGHDVSKLSNEVIEATRREYEQARDVLGRYAAKAKR